MPKPPSPDDRLSLDAVAEILSVSRKTVRRLVAAGQLPAERITPQLIRVRRHDVDALGRPVQIASPK